MTNGLLDLVTHGEASALDVFASGRRASATVESDRVRAARGKGAADAAVAKKDIRSPMPGRVIKVLVAAGDSVAPGAPLVVVEAMKMENELSAEGPGTVKDVLVKPGDAVEGGARLIVFE